jgi:hypothetical protein
LGRKLPEASIDAARTPGRGSSNRPRIAVPQEAGGKTAGVRVVDPRQQIRQVLERSHSAQAAGRPAADRGFGIGERRTEQIRALGARLAAEGVDRRRARRLERRDPGDRRPVGEGAGRRAGERRARDLDRRRLLEAEEEGQQPISRRRRVEGSQHPPDVGERCSQLAQGLDGQGSGLRVVVDCGAQQSGDAPLVVELPQGEGRRPPDRDLAVDQETLQHRTPARVADATERHGEILARLGLRGEQRREPGGLEFAPVGERQQQSAALERRIAGGRRRRRRWNRRRDGRGAARAGQDQSRKGEQRGATEHARMLPQGTARPAAGPR